MGFDPQYGARPLKRTLQRMIQDPLALEILKGRFPEGSKVVADAAGDAIEFRDA
jgi:ATP-dependent Clp protease ATP-binding subunit ClpB